MDAEGASLQSVDSFAFTEDQLERALVAQQPVEPGNASIFRAVANCLFFKATGENLGPGAKGNSTESVLHTRGTPAHVVQRLLTFWLQVHAGALSVLTPRYVTYEGGIDEARLFDRTGYRVANLKTPKELVDKAGLVREGKCVPTIPALIGVLSKWYARVTPYCYLGARTEEAEKRITFPSQLMTSNDDLRNLAKYASLDNNHRLSKMNMLRNVKQLLSTSKTPLLALWPSQQDDTEHRVVNVRQYPLGVSAPLDCVLDDEDRGEDEQQDVELVLGNPLVAIHDDPISMDDLSNCIMIARTAEGGQWVSVYPLLQAPEHDQASAGPHFALQFEQTRATHLGLEKSLQQYRDGDVPDKSVILVDAMRKLQSHMEEKQVRYLADAVLAAAHGDTPEFATEVRESIQVAVPHGKKAIEEEERTPADPVLLVDSTVLKDAARYVHDYDQAMDEERSEGDVRLEDGSTEASLTLEEGNLLANVAKIPLPTDDEQVNSEGVGAEMLWNTVIRESSVPSRVEPSFEYDQDYSLLRSDAHREESWNQDLITHPFAVGRPSDPLSFEPVVIPLHNPESNSSLAVLYKFLKTFSVGFDRGAQGLREPCIVVLKSKTLADPMVSCVAYLSTSQSKPITVSILPFTSGKEHIPSQYVNLISHEPLIELRISSLVPPLVLQVSKLSTGDVYRAKEALQYLAHNAVNTVKHSSPHLVPDEQARELLEGDRVYTNDDRLPRDITIRIPLSKWLTAGETHLHNLNHFIKSNLAVAARRNAGDAINLVLFGSGKAPNMDTLHSSELALRNIVVCKTHDPRHALIGQDAHFNLECMPTRISEKSIPGSSVVSLSTQVTCSLLLPTILLMLISLLSSDSVLKELTTVGKGNVDIELAKKQRP